MAIDTTTLDRKMYVPLKELPLGSLIFNVFFRFSTTHILITDAITTHIMIAVQQIIILCKIQGVKISFISFKFKGYFLQS